MRPIGQQCSLKLESVARADVRWAGWYWWRDPYSATRLPAHLAGRKPLIFKQNTPFFEATSKSKLLTITT
jgi:hypothetical protein